jgi:hypothetical protein
MLAAATTKIVAITVLIIIKAVVKGMVKIKAEVA